MASEARVTIDSIRKSARQLMQEYRADRSIEGDDVANVAHDLEDAAAEIARLTAELDAARERERRLRDHAEAVAASALPPSRRTTRVGNEALAGLRRALASTPPDTEGEA